MVLQISQVVLTTKDSPKFYAVLNKTDEVYPVVGWVLCEKTKCEKTNKETYNCGWIFVNGFFQIAENTSGFSHYIDEEYFNSLKFKISQMRPSLAKCDLQLLSNSRRA